MPVRCIRNISLGNVGFDLVDQNPGCDANRWLKNRARTTSQDCIDRTERLLSRRIEAVEAAGDQAGPYRA